MPSTLVWLKFSHRLKRSRVISQLQKLRSEQVDQQLERLMNISSFAKIVKLLETIKKAMMKSTVGLDGDRDGVEETLAGS